MTFLIILLLSTLSIHAKQTAYVHLFEWKWNDIAIEYTEFLGPKGFSAVQVSPPNEHSVLKKYPWYQRYQPVSYQLNSRSGTEAEFIRMVRVCDSVGVDIYVDAVINHMTSNDALTPVLVGNAGSVYGHYQYPLIYGYNDFHHCHLNSDDDIKNWLERWEVQNCELGNLADLKTESFYVQSQIKNYLRRLVDIGVKGFRIDAAKHIPAADLEQILKEIKDKVFIYQEIIAQPNEPIQPKEYFSLGTVTEFKYGSDIANIFLNGQLSWINNNKPIGEAWGYFPSSKAVVFLDNHDTQREQNSFSYKQKNKYLLANIFMLAWPYGYPQVMSSFAFQNRQQSPPSDINGNTKSVHGVEGIGCLNIGQIGRASEGWICEHRWEAIADMIEFRKLTEDEKEITNWWSNDNNQIAFSRGDKGFVVINNESQALTHNFQTGLPQGSYRDIIKNLKVEVDHLGMAAIHLGPESALVIHQKIVN